MSSDNVVVVISNNLKITEFINSKLVLLRDVDKVEHANTIEALDFLKKKIPNIIIVYAEANDSKRIKLISEIKSVETLKNIPIILIADKCTPDFLVEMFDVGISDIISTPIKEHELLFRLMWNIKKSEEYAHLEIQNKFLSNLGITQEKTGFFNEKYCEEFLTSQVEYAIEHNEQACVMLVSVENSDSEEENVDNFSEIIKKSIRLNDWAGIVGKMKYYLFFPKTKLNGAFAVFERLKKNSGLNYKINASVTEILDKTFDKIQGYLENSLVNSDNENSSLIVASENSLNSKKPSSVKNIQDEDISKVLQSVIKSNELEVVSENYQPKRILDTITKDETPNEQDEITLRNSIVFKQVYNQKCSMLLEPTFKKYKNIIEDLNKYAFVDYSVSPELSVFKASKGANELILSFKYEGFATVKIETVHVFNNREKSSDIIDVEVIKINKKLLNVIFDEFLDSLESC